MGNKAAAIVLTAGFSSRMGTFKPLLPMGEATVLERVLITLKEADVDPVIAVTGFQRESLEPILLKYGAFECFNPSFSQGMFSSIKTGTECFHNGNVPGAPLDLAPSEGFFLVPVDYPLIPANVYSSILNHRVLHPGKMIVPCYRGKKGHPLYVPAAFVDEILACDGKQGMKEVTDKEPERLVRLEVPDEAVVMDMDTREDYQELLEFMEKKGVQPRINAKRRLFLVRHGQIKQHKEPILLGQTDIPLSETGRTQAQEAGEVIRNHQAVISAIYTSDLQRARETAEIISRYLTHSTEAGRPAIVPVREFREMSLGILDGMYVSEFKEKHPLDYEQRGKNRLTYKLGHESENFYDLQYRVMKRLRRLAALTSGDILIVTHGGVIRIILSNLLGIPLEQALDLPIGNGEVFSLMWDPLGGSHLL